jgi:hypothetical protein
MPNKRRHDDGGLLQLVLAHALGVVGVGVARARVASRFGILDSCCEPPSRGAGYLAKRDGLAAWGCRRES